MTETDTHAIARENIRRLLSYREKSSFDVSTELGKNRTYIDDYLRGRKKSMSSDFLYKLTMYFAVSLDYLTGRDSLPEDARAARMFNPFSEIVPVDTTSIKGMVNTLMARYSIKIPDELFYGLTDRMQRVIEDKNDEIDRLLRKTDLLQHEIAKLGGKPVVTWGFPSEFLARYSIKSHLDIIVYLLIDTSMVGENGSNYLQGDYLIVDTSRRAITAGGVFLIDLRDELLARAIEPITNSQGSVRLKPFNESYPTIQLTNNEFRIIGRVVAHVSPS